MHRIASRGTLINNSLENCLQLFLFIIQDCHFTHHSGDLGGAFSNCDGEGDLFRGFLTDNKNVYEVQPVQPRHHGKLKQLDKRSGEKSNYHIITKKDIAGFRLPEMVFKLQFTYYSLPQPICTHSSDPYFRK